MPSTQPDNDINRTPTIEMMYEHVAMIPFLIDASHLTFEEAAERTMNPASWAARTLWAT